MVLMERRVKESPVEVRARVFEWAEKNKEEILELLEQGRQTRLDNLSLCNKSGNWKLSPKHLRAEEERCLSEMALCGEVKVIDKMLPLAGFAWKELIAVTDFRSKSGVVFEWELFDHVLLLGPGKMICCLTPGQFILGAQDLDVIYRLSDVANLRTYFPDEKFGPGDRLERLKELMPGAVKTFDGGLGVLCASVYVIDRELGLKFVEMAD